MVQVLNPRTVVHNITRNDIQECIKCLMHCVTLQSDEISAQFQHFVQIFIDFWTNFVLFLLFSSAADSLKWVFSQNTLRKPPSLSFLNKMYLTHYDRR